MAKVLKSIFFFVLILGSIFSATAQPSCTTRKLPNKRTFATCTDLHVLNSTVYWSYYSSNGTVDVAFRQTVVSDSRWVAWAINPTSTGMVGSQAIVAFKRTDGTMSVYSTPIKSYGTQLEQGNLSFPLFDVSAIYDNGQIIIFATIGLPNNVTVVNHVWQEGPLSGNTPKMHSISGPNVQSFGRLDFLSGKIKRSKGTSYVFTMKISHGIVNTISWGLLMPIGAIVARHFKAADPVWFHLHRACQMSAYVGGIAGYATGLVLGHKSSGVEYKGHRCIGITLFALATFQVVLALVFRPDKTHKKRVYWNLLHYIIGYGTIVLGIINILKGFDILEPAKKWKYTYIAIISLLVCTAIVLELRKWYLAWRAKSQPTGQESIAPRVDNRNEIV